MPKKIKHIQMHLKSVNLGLLLLSTMSIQEKLLEILLLYNDYRLNISKEEVFKTLSIVENRIDNRSTFIQKSKADLMFKGNSLLKLDDAISLILEDQNCQSLLMMITAIVKQGTGERVFDDNIIDDPDDQNQNFMSSIIFGKSSLIQEENVSSSEINQSNDLSSSNKIVNQSILNDDQILEKQGKHEIVAKPKIAKKCLKKKSIRSPEKSRFDILSQMISTKKQVSFDLSKNQTSYIDFKQIINHNKQNVPVDNSWMVSFNEQQNLQQKVFKRNSISKQNSLDYNQSQEKDQDEQKQCLIF